MSNIVDGIYLSTKEKKAESTPVRVAGGYVYPDLSRTLIEDWLVFHKLDGPIEPSGKILPEHLDP